MAIFTIQLADGRKARVQAPDQASAVKAAQGIPALTGDKATYQGELVKQRASLKDQGDAYRKVPGLKRLEAGAVGAFSPIMGEVVGGANALGNAAVNLKRRASGEAPVSSREIYNAGRDATDEYFADTRKEFPASSIVGDVASWIGGEKLLMKGGGLLAGLKPVKAATDAVKATRAARATARAAAPVVAAATIAAPRATKVAKRIGKATASGAATGVLLGAAEGGSAEERLENAGETGLLGGLGGAAAEGIVAPAAKWAGKRAGGVVKDVLRAARKPTPEQERELGTKTAIALLARKGLTADNAAERFAMAGPGATAAEVGGRESERQLAATARRGGETGDVVADIVRARREGAPERQLGAINESLGMNAAKAAGNVDEMVTMGRALADPEYAALRAKEGGVWNDELQELSQRPSVKRAMGKVEEAGLDMPGRPGEGMAMGTVDVPSRPVGPDDLSFGATGAPEAMRVPRGPAEAPGRGPSALTYLRMTGHGISDSMAGEAAQAGLRLGAKKGGAELNDMAIRLNEAGYTPRVLAEDEMAELLDSGMAAKLWAREPEAAAQGRFEARQSAEEFNRRGGDPESLPNPEDYGNAGMAPERPLTEPARQTAPRIATWDKVKRTLDALVKRDQFGKIIRHGDDGLENERLEVVARELREALKRADPDYEKALGVSGDYMSIQSAFNQGKGRLLQGSEADFRKAWKSLKTDADRDAFKSAVANDIHELWSQGLLRAGRIRVPRVMGKLELAFGRNGARQFLDRIEQEAKLAASGNRLVQGSPTMELNAAAKEGDEAVMQTGDLGRIAGKLFSGHPVRAAGDALMTAARRGAAYSETAGMSRGMRDAYGEILAIQDPADLIPWLKQIESLPPQLQEVVHDRAARLGLLSGIVADRAVTGDRYGAQPE